MAKDLGNKNKKVGDIISPYCTWKVVLVGNRRDNVEFWHEYRAQLRIDFTLQHERIHIRHQISNGGTEGINKKNNENIEPPFLSSQLIQKSI